MLDTYMASVAYLTDYHSLEWESPTQDALLLKGENGSINYSSWFENYAGREAVNLNLFMGFASDPEKSWAFVIWISVSSGVCVNIAWNRLVIIR